MKQVEPAAYDLVCKVGWFAQIMVLFKELGVYAICVLQCGTKIA